MIVSDQTHRLPLKPRRDLQFAEVDMRGDRRTIVKDPVSLKYYRLPPEQLELLELLTTGQTLLSLHQALQSRFPRSRIVASELQQMLVDLQQRGLLVVDRPDRAARNEQDLVRERQRRRWAVLANPLYIRFPGWDPDRLLRLLQPLARLLFNRTMFIAACGLILSGWGLLVIHADSFQRQWSTQIDLVRGQDLLLLWLAIGVAKLIHELAHGLACRRFGGECHEIGVALLVFSPCLYCDVSNAWMLPRRRDRILIAAVGMLAELCVSTVALFLWWFAVPGPTRTLLFHVFLVTSVATVLFNANPLLRYDGYYILCDWIGIPNLRAKASAALHGWCGRVFLGRPASTQRDSLPRWLPLFALASIIYRWLLLLGILLFLQHWLTPWGLQRMAWLVLLLPLLASLMTLTRRVTRQFESGPGDRRMSWKRCVFSTFAAAGVLAAAVLIPLPRSAQVPCILQPAGMRPVFSKVDGVLADVLVRPGQRVTAGEPLALLDNEDLLERAAEIEVRRRRQQVRRLYYRTIGDVAGIELARSALQTLDQQAAAAAGELAELVIVAPCAGTIIEIDDQDDGPLLDPGRVGARITRFALVCQIAPDDQWEGQLLLDHSQSREVAAGDVLTIRPAQDRADDMTGTVEKIAPRDERSVPAVAAQKFGGQLTTLPDASGRERSLHEVYEARVRLSGGPASLRAGSRGTARIELPPQSAWSRLATYVQQTFTI